MSLAECVGEIIKSIDDGPSDHARTHGLIAGLINEDPKSAHDLAFFAAFFAAQFASIIADLKLKDLTADQLIDAVVAEALA